MRNEIAEPGSRTGALSELLAACSRFLQCLLHGGSPLLDELADRGGEVVGQHVGDPDEPTAVRIFCKDLHRRIVVRGPPLDRRVGKPARLVVNVDDQLAYHRTVPESDDPGVSFEAGIDDEAWREALVDRADIANRRPNDLRAGLDQDFLVDGSHVSVSCLLAFPCMYLSTKRTTFLCSIYRLMRTGSFLIDIQFGNSPASIARLLNLVAHLVGRGITTQCLPLTFLHCVRNVASGMPSLCQIWEKLSWATWRSKTMEMHP